MALMPTIFVYLLSLLTTAACFGPNTEWSGAVFRVNEVTANSQVFASVCVLNDGRFVVGFSSTGFQSASLIDPVFRSYDHFGVALTGSEQIGGFTGISTSLQSMSTCASLPTTGGFALMLYTVTSGPDPSRGIYLEQFDSTFNHVLSELLHVNIGTNSIQWTGPIAEYRVPRALIGFPEADLMVAVYHSRHDDTTGDVFGVGYRVSDHGLVWAEVDLGVGVGAGSVDQQDDPGIDALSDQTCRAAVAFATDDGGIAGWTAVYLGILNACDGTWNSSAVQVVDDSANADQVFVTVISDDFVVVAFTSSANSVRAGVFEIKNDGTAPVLRGTLFDLVDLGGSYDDPTIARVRDNVFIAVWTELAVGPDQICAKIFEFVPGTNDVNELEPRFTVSPLVDGIQNPSVAVNRDRAFFTWQESALAPTGEIYARVLLLPQGPPRLGNDRVAISIEEAHAGNILVPSTHFKIFYHRASRIDSLLVFVRETTNVRFEYEGNPGVEITQFYVANLTTGDVGVQQYGGQFTPTAKIQLFDPIANVTEGERDDAMGYVHDLEFALIPDDVYLGIGGAISILQGDPSPSITTTEIVLSRPLWTDRTDFLTFDVVSVNWGEFQRSGIGVTAFSMSELVAGEIVFQHSGSNNTPTCSLQGRDPVDSRMSVVRACSFSFTLDPIEVIVGIAISVHEGETVSIEMAHFDGTRVERPGNHMNLIVVVTAPASGIFLLSGAPATEFSIQDIDDGNVNFRHDDSESAPSCLVHIRDPFDGRTSETTESCSFSYASVDLSLSRNSFRSVKGRSVVVTLANVNANYPYHDPFLVTVFLSDVQSGDFLLDETDVVMMFTLQEVNDGRIAFLHTGLDPPTCGLYVEYGTDSTTQVDCNFDFECPPALERNYIVIDDEANHVTLTDTMMSASDCDTDADLLWFHVVSVVNGMFVMASDRDFELLSWQQRDIVSGKIVVVPDSPKKRFGCALNVSDGFSFTEFECSVAQNLDKLDGTALAVGLSLSFVSISLCVVMVIVVVFVWLYLRARGRKRILLPEDLLDVDDPSIPKFTMHKDMFEIDWNELELKKSIGAGGGGATVYLATWKGSDVAFKIFRTSDLAKEADFDEFQKELEVMSSFQHPNLLRFFGASLNIPRVGIVMEYCSGGDLHQLIGRIEIGQKDRFSFLESLRILIGIVRGLSHLHSRSIIHRDVKSANILLGRDNVPKLIGLSKIVKRAQAALHTRRIGTSVYMAPEITLACAYDEKVDVFSFGIVMYEFVFVTTQPYGDRQDETCIEVQVANNPEFRPTFNDAQKKSVPTWFISLIKQCWDHVAEVRPNCDELEEQFGVRILELVEKRVQAETPTETAVEATPVLKVGQVKVEEEVKEEVSDDEVVAADSSLSVRRSLTLYFKNPDDDDDDADDYVLKDLTLTGLLIAASEWKRCDVTDIDKLCRFSSTGRRLKISRDETVQALDQDALIAVFLKES